jgi:hypothetical protein
MRPLEDEYFALNFLLRKCSYDLKIVDASMGSYQHFQFMKFNCQKGQPTRELLVDRNQAFW